MRDLSSIIWAWGTFGYAPAATAFLLDVAESRLQQGNAHDLANLMWGLASWRPALATPGLVREAEQHACSISASFSPQVCSLGLFRGFSTNARRQSCNTGRCLQDHDVGWREQ